jgi:phenylacetate-coenzyme A ligase PaaK-like adenylate-forming protein
MARKQVCHCLGDGKVVVGFEKKRLPPGSMLSSMMAAPEATISFTGGHRSLTNRVMPLVRYEISDVVTMATEPCSCGLPFWRIAQIEGRNEEILRFKKRGGGVVDVLGHRLRSALTGTNGVRQFQFAQLADGLEITIALFSGTDVEGTSNKIERAVRAALEAVDAQPEQVLVRVVEAIDRSGTGAKEKLVVGYSIGADE